ncbi:MAG: hypothetical protein H0U53_02240 [Actinobacteria bacterium]|nr:hypothetical protein [Actinomycetota bacterium]
MRPDVITPAREAARLECAMHEIMNDLVERGDIAAAPKCRSQLKPMSLRRHDLSRAEVARAIATISRSS